MQAVVLASGSQYRAELLGRLGIDFQVMGPDINESPLAGETPPALSSRLARQKAEKAARILAQTTGKMPAAAQADSHVIIGSDQVASSGNVMLGKPGTVELACAQLAGMSGQRVQFFTALHMLDTRTGHCFSALDTTTVTLRMLDSDTIARYVERDQPLDCAGSFKVESLGISLFESVTSDDPTALVGLPLIKVCEGFRQLGLPLF